MTYPGIENDKTALAVNPDLLAVEERRKAREEEFGTWVAKVNIPWGTVLAAVPGDRIPNGHIERYKWDELGLVVRRTSKEGREILERTGTATTEERERWAEEDKAAARAERERAAAENTTDTASAKSTAKKGTGN